MEEEKVRLQHVVDHGAPQGDGWEQMFKTKGFDEAMGGARHHGMSVTFWRKPTADTPGVFEYMLLGTAPFTSALLFNVIDDLDRRKEWDPNCALVHWLHKAEKFQGTDILHMEVAYPFPLANRDYVFSRKSERFHEDDGKSYVTLCEVTTHVERPESRTPIRVIDFHQKFLIKPKTVDSCLFVIATRDDPRGRIPKSVVNWAIRKALPALADSLFERCKACEGMYPEEDSSKPASPKPSNRVPMKKRSRLLHI